MFSLLKKIVFRVYTFLYFSVAKSRTDKLFYKHNAVNPKDSLSISVRHNREPVSGESSNARGTA